MLTFCAHLSLEQSISFDKVNPLRLLDQWDVGPIGCRTNGLSDQWAVGLMGCRTNGKSPSIHGTVLVRFAVPIALQYWHAHN